MKIYLAGPMRGKPDQNFRAFFMAAAMLEMKGHTVVNPARLDIEQGTAQWSPQEKRLNVLSSFTIEDAMRRDCLEMARNCYVIALLPGWENSEGANNELDFARMCGFSVVKYDPETEDIEPLDETP